MPSAFNQAWALLKALPEQQMFVNPAPRQNLEDEDWDNMHLPEIDAKGARSMGTTHPAILGLLQRIQDERMADYGEPGTFKPDMSLDDTYGSETVAPRTNEALAIRESEGVGLGERPPADSDMYLEHRASGRTPFTGNMNEIDASALNPEGTSHHYTHPTQKYRDDTKRRWGQDLGENPHADSQPLNIGG